MTSPNFDVAIIGGGPAGLSAAITLSRSLRSVVVIDAGQPRNAKSSGAHNILGQDGISPLELRAKGRAEALSYGAVLIDARVFSISHNKKFELTTNNGETYFSDRVVLATGLTDALPEIPGIGAGWGTNVLHCPYCHGWETKDSHIVIVGTSPMSTHQALMFAQFSDKVTLLIHDSIASPNDEQLKQLENAGVSISETPVSEVREKTLMLKSGNQLGYDYLVVAPTFNVNGELFESLGGTLEETPMGLIIPTGLRGRTPVGGVWAAGNNADMAAMVVTAMAEGVAVATDINAELI